MPSASAKLEKQASTESTEPIKQGIIIIEHKIRNLEKRKSRLESYKDQQSSGKELNSDQLAAIAKYDEVQQTLEFARELCKQFNGIANETAKLQKKQARKDALERSQQELMKIKEILLIQDVLANMGQESIREDFLAGRNGAVKLTEEDLQNLDDLFTEVSPKRETEESVVPFSEQVLKAAEHLIFLTEGKNKEVVGTTYNQLRQKILEIHSCGYFDVSSGADAVAEAVTESTVMIPCEEVEVDEEEPELVPTATFQSSKIPPMAATVPVLIETKDHPPQISTKIVSPSQMQQPPANEVISSVMSATSSFHFLQDSELDTPEIIPTPTAPPPSALPIPSQTFTNQNFAPPQQNFPQPQAQPAPVYSSIPISGQQASAYVPFTSSPQLQVHHPPATYPQQGPVQVQSTPQQQPSKPVERVTDWNNSSASSASNVIDNSDWNVQCDNAAAAAAENAWQQQKSSDSWSVSDSQGQHQVNNDGFVTAGSRGGFGRGGRGGGRGGGNRGGSRGGGGRNSGGNYYRNNNSAGGDGTNISNSNNYQSNGYQNRGNISGDHNKRGGLNAGGRAGGGLRSDRGGPRGGNSGNRGGGGRSGPNNRQ